MASPCTEDYVKAIYKAGLETHGVTTQDIAKRVGVGSPAVSKMLRRLAKLQLVEHSPYRGVRITAAGERLALAVLRRHRLLEMYLVHALGYTWDEVHDEAERLEHHISEQLVDRIDAYLGYPVADPHGDPIPTHDGRIVAPEGRPLALQSGPAHLTIRRVVENAALLRYLKSLGLVPGTEIEFLEQEPFGGSFLLRVGDEVIRVAPHAAAQIYI